MTARRPSTVRTLTGLAVAVGAAVAVNSALPAGAPAVVDWDGPAGTTLRLVLAVVLGALLCLLLASVRTPGQLPHRLRLVAVGLRTPVRGRLWFLCRAAAEEAVWRGCLLPALAVPLGVPAAVLVSSAVFGLAHAHQRRTGIAANTVNGCAFALSYLFLGGLPAAMATHLAHNTVLASLLVGRRGSGGHGRSTHDGDDDVNTHLRRGDQTVRGEGGGSGAELPGARR